MLFRFYKFLRTVFSPIIDGYRQTGTFEMSRKAALKQAIGDIENTAPLLNIQSSRTDNQTSQDQSTAKTGSGTWKGRADSTAKSGNERGLCHGRTNTALLQSLGTSKAPDITAKILVVGNAKCGKSSIISRVVRDSFEEVRVFPT